MIQNRDIIIDELNKYMDKLNIELSKEQLNQFATFYELLIEKNKVMNLTAIVEPEEVAKNILLIVFLFLIKDMLKE